MNNTAIDAYWNFFEAYNTQDANVFSAALSYPHVRVSSRGVPAVVPTLEAHAAQHDWERSLAMGWHHSEGHEPEVIFSGEDRAHIVGGWTRKDAQGNDILHNRVTYTATKTERGWGIQCRFGIDGGDALASGETGDNLARAIDIVSRHAESGGELINPFFEIGVGRVDSDEAPEAVSVADIRAVQGGQNGVTVAANGGSAIFFVVNKEGWGVQARSIGAEG